MLAWVIPRTEEPGGLQSTESQRVRHDWATKQQQFLECSDPGPPTAPPLTHASLLPPAWSRGHCPPSHRCSAPLPLPHQHSPGRLPNLGQIQLSASSRPTLGQQKTQLPKHLLYFFSSRLCLNHLESVTPLPFHSSDSYQSHQWPTLPDPGSALSLHLTWL